MLKSNAKESDSLVNKPELEGDPKSSVLRLESVKVGVSTSNSKYHARPIADKYREGKLKRTPTGV